MIPENSDIKKRLKPEHTIHFVLYTHDYFKKADDFVRLSKKFITTTFFETAMLWFEMIISPLLTFGTAWYSNTSPGFLSMIGLQKCMQIWQDWFHFRELTGEIREWTNIVRSIGGPFISSNDAKYHVYVYADGMQRIRNSLTLRGRSITKERAKRL
jgi:hypothetical protein